MAFDDALIGSDDFDPQTATEDLIRQTAGGPLPVTLDPRMLNTRLARKLGEPMPAAEPVDIKPEKAEAPDFSGQAAEPEVTSPNAELDFSAQAVPANTPQTPPAPPALGVGGQLAAAAKGVPHGAIEHTGGILKGAARLHNDAQPYLKSLEYDPYGNIIEQKPVQPAAPIAEHPLYKAGKATADFAQTIAPMSEQEKDSIGGRVGAGAGSIIPYALTTVIAGPLAGLGSGAIGMATDTFGQVFEEAKKHGAADDVAESAAARSALVAGVLGSLPLGAGKYAKTLISKVASSSAAFATLGEAQEAILQEIAKDYDPKAGYTFEQKRLIAALILGAGMGGLHHAFDRRGQQQPGQQQPGAQPTGPGGQVPPPGAQPGPNPNGWPGGTGSWGTPPPGGGPQPGAGPRPGAGTPPPGGGAGPQPGGPGAGAGPQPGAKPGGPPPGSGTGKAGDPSYTMDPAMRAKMERIYRTFERGKSPSNLSDGELYDAVNEHLRDTSSTGYTAKPETPEEAAAREQAATERTEREALKRRGWTDAHINAMTPEQRRKYFQDAMAGEQTPPPGDRAADSAQQRTSAEAQRPENVATSPDDVRAATSDRYTQAASAPVKPTSKSDVPRATGTRGDPIEIRTAEDVAAVTAPASGDYTHAQGEANNRQLGHGKWNDRAVRMEVAKGGVRKMQNPETGEPVEVTHGGAAYGYFPGTTGADGMHVDLYLGDHPESPNVYVIDEIDRNTGKFRQHKVMGGFPTERDAFAAYVQTSTKGPETVGGITRMSRAELNNWLDSGNTTKALKPTSTGPDKTVEAGPRPLTEATGEAPKETPAGDTGARAADRSATPTPKPRAGSDQPLSLLQFIASKGGLAPHTELSALGFDGKRRVQIPGRKGFFGVVRPGGMSLDYMREAIEEAGYLRGEAGQTSTVRQLLDAMSEEDRGNRLDAEGNEGTLSKREQVLAREREEHERERHEIEYGTATADLIDAGYTGLRNDLHDAAVRLMVDEGMSPDDAVERAALHLVATDGDYAVTPDTIKDTFGGGTYDEIRAAAASEDGGRSPRQREEGARPGEGQEDRGDGTDVPDSGAQGRETAGEVAQARAEVEAALGPDADIVLPVDIARAAEIMVDNPGIPPEIAFGQAVAAGTVDQGFLTKEQAEAAYGPEINDVLESGQEGTPVRAGDVEQEHAKPDESGAGDTAQGGVVSRGGKTRGKGAEGETDRAVAETAAGKAGAAARRDEAARDEAGDTAENRPAAEDADKPVGEFIADIERRIAEGDYDADIAPTRSISDLREAAEARGWVHGAYGKGKALWSPDRKHAMLYHVAVEGNYINVQWGEPTDGVTPPPSAKVLAADSDETVTVTLSREGPWDFNDTFPAPDPEHLAAMDREGRAVFYDPSDPAEIANAVDAGVYDMIEEMGTIRTADAEIADVRSGKIKLKKKETAADRIAALTKERAKAIEMLRGHQGTFEDIFGKDAARAMMIEARKRIVQEEGQRDNGVDRRVPVESEPEPEAKPAKAKSIDDLTEAEKKAHADAPTWAEILAELPMHKDGRTREHEIAFAIMKEAFGQKKPNFNRLTPEQKVHLLDRVKDREPVDLNANKALWQLADTADRQLGGEAARVIDGWVGGGPGAAKAGATHGIWNWERIEEALAMDGQVKRDIAEAFKPVKAYLKKLYGDTLTLHRYERSDTQPGGRTVYSYTADPEGMAHYANAPKERKLFTEADISKAEKTFAETGRVDVGPGKMYLERQESVRPGLTYVAIMDPAVGGEVTDTESVRSYMEQENKHRQEINDEREAKLARAKTEKIPLDQIVWVTDRFNQREFVVRKEPAKDAFDDIFDAAVEEQFAKPAKSDVYDYTIDNPGGRWLAEKQEDALKDQRSKQSKGSPTAFLRPKGNERISLPTDLLARVPGYRDEIRRPGDGQYDALLADVQKNGWKNEDSILIRVNHLGKPYILEGNTRVAVAKAVGQKTVPVWVDWMNGAEQTPGPWHPDNILPKVTKAEATAPTTETGADGKPQTVIPGAEQAPSATMAKRAAAAPLKPKVAQRPADIGLFGDESKQSDMMDMLAKAPPPPQGGSMSLDDVAKGLGALFGKKPPGLSEQEPQFSDDTYQQAPQRRPAGESGQQWALEQGRKTGTEYMVAYGADGREMGRTGGKLQRFVAFTPEFVTELNNPANDIVAHHNHPGGTSLSNTDLMALAFPGLRAIWAHGNNGNVYRGELTPAFEALVFPTPNAKSKKIEGLYKIAQWRLQPIIQVAVTARTVTVDEANGGLNHLVNEVLADAGIIDYRSNYELGDFVSRVPDLDKSLKNAVAAVRKEAFGATADSNRVDRRAGPLRHVGDLGASFDRADVAAAVGGEGRSSPLGEESDFREEGPGLAQPDNTFKKPGSFDSSIGDILGRRLLGRMSDLNATEARTQLQDKFARVKNAEESVGAPSTLSAYQAESLYYGRTGHRLEQLRENHIDPIIREMKARDVELGKLDDFLSASHAPERNDKIGAMYPPHHDFNRAMRDHDIVGGSGWSTNEALRVIRDLRASGKLSDYLAVARMVWALNFRTRRALYDAGLIDRDTFDAWNAAYKYYTPQRGHAEGDQFMPSSSGMNVRGKEARTAFGRRSKADSPLAYSIMQAEMAIIRAEKKKVGNTFLQFVRANPDPARWTVDRPPLVKRIDPATGLVTSMPNNLYADHDNVFTTKENGKDVYITLHGPDGLNLARALKNMGTANVHKFIRAYATVTHTMAKMATAWNPEFMIPNLIRDVGEAFINLSAQQQRDFVRKFVGHMGGAMKGSSEAIAIGHNGGPPLTGDPYVDAFNRFDKAGGRIRFFGIDDPDAIEINVNKRLARLDGGTINNVKDMADKLGKALEIAGGGIENATRLAAFMAAEDVGMSTADAAMLARNLTVDFNKKGELGGAISALYMFANAGIQGQARMIKALGHRRVWAAVGALAAAAALSTLFSLLNGETDEADTPAYMKVPKWERDKNLIFMMPSGLYFKVPLPYGFAPFGVIGSRSITTLMGHDAPGVSAHAVMDSILNAFNPLGEESGILMDLIPSAMRPAFHIYFNKNWTGKELYPEQDKQRGARPDSTQSFKSDSAFSKEAARLLNEWSGGGPYKSGNIDVHPASIDHTLQAITGGVGRFVKGIADSFYRNVITGEEWQPEKTPILRRFVGKIGEQHDAALFYEKRKEVRDLAANAAQAKKDQRTGTNAEAAREFLANDKIVTQKAIFERADNAMSRLRQNETEINNSSRPDEEKRTEINRIRQEMRSIQNKARAESVKLNRQGASP